MLQPYLLVVSSLIFGNAHTKITCITHKILSRIEVYKRAQENSLIKKEENMNDFIREILSYGELFKRMRQAEKVVEAEKIPYGSHKSQYFLYYEPKEIISGKVIVWVHGGGWNSGSPEYFDFVGQCFSKHGYSCISIGYRLSPKNKYPSQIQDVCAGFKGALDFLKSRKVNCSKLVVSGPSAGAHLTSLLCYSKEIQESEKIDISNVIGFIGVGGPYKFDEKSGLALKILLAQLFEKGYERKKAEPYSMIRESNIPMLLIQSEHDGVIHISSTKEFFEKAKIRVKDCQLYWVQDAKNTHSWYTTGMFLESRSEYKALDKFFSWIENLN